MIRSCVVPLDTYGFCFSKAVPAAAITDLLRVQPWAHLHDKAVVWGVEGVFPVSALMSLS